MRASFQREPEVTKLFTSSKRSTLTVIGLLFPLKSIESFSERIVKESETISKPSPEILVVSPRYAGFIKSSAPTAFINVINSSKLKDP